MRAVLKLFLRIFLNGRILKNLLRLLCRESASMFYCLVDYKQAIFFEPSLFKLLLVGLADLLV